MSALLRSRDRDTALSRQGAVINWALLRLLCAGLVIIGAAAGSSDVADAAMARDRGRIRTLVEQKADANTPQADGATALHWAAHWDDLETAGLLLAAGAKPMAANREGATPMFLASENGSAAGSIRRRQKWQAAPGMSRPADRYRASRRPVPKDMR